MPPKPWEVKPTVASPDLARHIAANNPAPQTPLAPSVASPDISTTPTAANPANGNNSINGSSYGSGYGTGYGSSLGGGYGYGGGYGSGYGSSYGYGGMSSMYGGGMYGYRGMMGGGTGPPQGNLIKVLGFFQSLNFIVNILGQISKRVQTNSQGIGRFYLSFKSLLCRIAGAFKNCWTWLYDKLLAVVRLCRGLFDSRVEQLENKELRERRRLRDSLSRVLKVTIVLLLVSMYPIIAKAIRK